jgi:hypothetical protein
MIVLLCTSRSGSSMIASMFAASGLNCGEVSYTQGYCAFENMAMKDHIKAMAKRGRNIFPEWVPALGGTQELAQKLNLQLFKCSVECWKPFEPFSTAVKIKRNIHSAAKSVTDKNGSDYNEAVDMINERYRLLDGIDGPTINTDKVIAGDLSEVRQAFEYCGLEFDEAQAQACIKPEMWHYRAC